MNKLINRPSALHKIKELMSLFPVTILLGPRQCGKTTLAMMLQGDHYFDLENPRSSVQLENPQLTLESLSGTIIIDEIQRKPELFPLLRYLVDDNPGQKYVLLGSASPELIRHSSESLAGRAGFFELACRILIEQPEARALSEADVEKLKKAGSV
jgi:hypothetical protein